jgi:hypothetical protein
MIKFIAQMKNPRRGHDTQGRLKRVHLDQTTEGYANYMAPMRVQRIKEQESQRGEKASKLNVMTHQILNPEFDTYLTPNWDEFVPCPMTWKIRFDGFGESNYKDHTGNLYGRVKTGPTLPDYLPPWYQPQGASTVGGAFADIVCICAEAEAGAKEAKDGRLLNNGAAGKEKEKNYHHECPCLGHTNKMKLEPNKALQITTGCGLGDNHVHK